MHPYVAYELSRAKLDELRREADRARLIRSVTASGRAAPIPRSHRRVRAALGGGLVRLGLRLAEAEQLEW